VGGVVCISLFVCLHSEVLSLAEVEMRILTVCLVFALVCEPLTIDPYISWFTLGEAL